MGIYGIYERNKREMMINPNDLYPQKHASKPTPEKLRDAIYGPATRGVLLRRDEHEADSIMDRLEISVDSLQRRLRRTTVQANQLRDEREALAVENGRLIRQIEEFRRRVLAADLLAGVAIGVAVAAVCLWWWGA